MAYFPVIDTITPDHKVLVKNAVEARSFRRQCVELLDGLLEHIETLIGDSVYTLNDEQLSTLDIQKAEPLDIEERSVDFAPRFFKPRFTLEEARKKTNDFLSGNGRDLGYGDWPKRCRRGSYVGFDFEATPGSYDPEERHPLCHPMTDADIRLGWFLNAVGVRFVGGFDPQNRGLWEDSEWRFLRLGQEICFHLEKAGISNHVARLSQKADATESYKEWIVIQDSTLPSSSAENLFGVELVSPIFYTQRKQEWIPEIRKIWRILEERFEVHATRECSTHIHLSPASGPWTLSTARGVAKAAVFFERCIDALMPGHRRINPYCMSNRRNARYGCGMDITQIFDDVNQAESLEDLGERMCWCSRDSVHARQTLHEDDFVHPHFRWNLTALTESRTRTIEFRQPPASRNARDTLTWVLFATCFAQWAAERADAALDPAEPPAIANLYRYVRTGAHANGVQDDMLSLLEGLFRGAKPLPVPRHDLKRMSEEELEAEATKKRMSLERYKELFAYE
ncbi:hypothetical protein VTH82DRAFT_1371 [Thermothelomyces myriococcoides]